MTDKDSLVFLKHVLESINNIEMFTKNVSKPDFLKNKEKQSAVVRQIEIIGEAVKNLSQDFKEEHPEVQWRYIVGTRDKIIHHYFGVDLQIVWEIIEKDLPKLKKQIENIIYNTKT